MSEGGSAFHATTPHDALFRMAFCEPEVAIPQVKAMVPGGYHRWLELDGLAVEASAFVSETLRPQYGDMLYRIPLAASDGAFLWFLVEHFSASHRFMPLRCLGYESEIWRRYRRNEKGVTELPLIVPMVVSHDPRGWTMPRSLSALYGGPPGLRALFEPYLLKQRCLIDDLSRQTEEALSVRSESAYARLVWWSLRSRGNVDPGRKRAWVEEFYKLMEQDKGHVAQALMEYHWNVSNQKSPVAIEAAMEASEELEEHALTYLERIKLEAGEKGSKQWHQRGREQGIQEGRQQGQSAMLLRQLRLRFGDAVTSEIEARVRLGSSEALATCFDRVLTESTLEAVLAPLED